jgi:predicted MPP superfamily phosphohydrolase
VCTVVNCSVCEIARANCNYVLCLINPITNRNQTLFVVTHTLDNLVSEVVGMVTALDNHAKNVTIFNEKKMVGSLFMVSIIVKLIYCIM